MHSRLRTQSDEGNGGDQLACAALADAVAAVRGLDAAHLYQVGQVRGEFFDHLRPRPGSDRRAPGGYRDVLVAGRGGAGRRAGGRTGARAAPVQRGRRGQSPVIAWSAGAMALAERIVLFGDRAPQGGSPRCTAAG
jgi:hypothetical protein